jgi:hypothetical protein
LGHDKAALDAPGGISLQGLPIRNEDKGLVEHLLWRFLSLSVLDSTHHGHDDTHAGTTLFGFVAVVNILGGVVLKGGIEDMGVERLDIVVDACALRLEEVVVVGRRCYLGPVDRYISRDGVSAGRIDIEGKERLATVERIVIIVNKDLGGCVGKLVRRD